MRKLYSTLMLSIVFCIIFTSCTAIYSELPEVDTISPNTVDESKEYFTTGSVYEKGNIGIGYLHDGYWIYRELQNYEYSYQRADGKIVSSNAQITRLVKANAVTGAVSSLCLDPVCNHSIGSGCIMIQPQGGSTVIQGFVGDYIIFTYGIRDDVYGLINKSYAYNLKTGEAKTIFEQDMANEILTKYSSKYIFGDTYYAVKNILDYSNTGYDPQNPRSLSEYDPETTSILCEYGVTGNTVKELFEIPEDYSLIIVSSKRFFFMNSEGEVYSCSRNGKKMTKEKVLDFSPYQVCGTYAYNVDEQSRDMEIYDLLTNTKHELPNDLRSTSYNITDIGIIKNDLSVYEEYMRIRNSYHELKEQGITPTPADHDKLVKNIRCSGTTQIWKYNHDGSSPQKIFEIDKALLDIQYATNDFLYGFVFRADPNNNYEAAPYENEGRCYINIKTGEITPIPYLELIIPELVELE